MLQVNFIMSYIIHQISALIRIIRILKRFLRNIAVLIIITEIHQNMTNNYFFSQHIMLESSKL